jgi:preprotein translocase subunit YajC
MLDWLIGTAQAAPAATAAAAAPVQGPAQYDTLALPILMLVVFYYFLIHMPTQKRRKEREAMFSGMKRGDDVLTTGGIYGKITGVADQTVNLEIAPKIRIKVSKSAIAQVLAPSQVEEETKE